MRGAIHIPAVVSTVTLNESYGSEVESATQVEAVEHHFENIKDPFFSNSLKSGNRSIGDTSGEVIQAKLKIGSPNDKYEREADAIADLVVQRIEQSRTVRNVQNSSKNLSKPLSISPIQRKCDTCEQEEKLKKKKEKNKDIEIRTKPILENLDNSAQENIQIKAGDPNNSRKGFELESSLASSKGLGQPLSDEVRSEMESGFGSDFGVVRIHTGQDAIQMNQQIGARAFTHGNDIYFNQGQYAPNAIAGKTLLAHELTHTIQQKGKQSITLQRNCREDYDKWVTENIGPLKYNEEERRYEYTKKDREDRDLIADNLSDDKKAKLRKIVKECATKHTELIIAQQKKSKTKSKEKSFSRKIKKLTDQGIQNIRRFRRQNRTEAAQREEELRLREQDLIGVKAGMDSALVTFHFYRMKELFYRKIKIIGDPKKKFEKLGMFRQSLFLFSIFKQHGEKALLSRKYEDGLFEIAGISRSALKPSAPADPNAQPSPTPTDKDASGSDFDEKDLEIVLDFFRKLEEKNLPAMPGADMKKLADMLRGMDISQKESFIELYNAIEVPEGEDAEKEMENKINIFNNLTELEREVLKANLERQKETSSKDDKALSDKGKIRLQRTLENAENDTKNFKSMNGQLEDIWRQVSGSSNPDAKSFKPIDEKGFISLQNEMAILNGLLEGAQERSPHIKAAATGLRKEISKLRESIMKEIIRITVQIAIETAAGALISFLTAGTGGVAVAARVAFLVQKLNKVRRLIETARDAMKIVTSIKDVFEKIADAESYIESFREKFEEKFQHFRTLKAQLDTIEGQEDLDDKVAEAQEALLELIQNELDGKLGDLLENLYLPPDSTEEDLMNILLDLPDGFKALNAVWTKYEEGESAANPEQFPGILFTRALTAGRKLFPFVGFMAGKAGEALSTFNKNAGFTTGKLEAGLERMITGTRPFRRNGRKQRRKENRQRFSRFRFKRYKYEQGSYEKPNTIKWALKKGFTWIKSEFQPGHEKFSFNGFWTRAWFRHAARKKVRELNSKRSSWRVWATVKGKKPATRERVPIPKFKLKWLSRRPPFAFTLKLNPTYEKGKVSVNNLRYAAFKDGIRFNTGDAKRTNALEQGLAQKGYAVIRDVKVKNFIRHTAKWRGPGRNGKLYLQIEAGIIKQDPKLAITKSHISDFVGRDVATDLDLPEGFVLSSWKGKELIARKWGAKPLLKGIKLGIDDNGKLVAEDRKFPIRRTKLKIHKWNFESLVDPEGMADSMFRKDGVTPRAKYKTRNRSRQWWRRHIRKTSELQKRPKFIHVTLGNTKFARAEGDALGSRHLPQQFTSDDKGHIVAKRFDGNDSYNNLVPMDSTINRANKRGTWYFHEKGFAGDFRRGRKNVEVKITLYYNNSRTRRPYRFSVKYRILDFNPKTKKWDKRPEKNLRRRIIQ